VTDVALVTSLRDGMNLVSYEYVACQSENAGVVDVSRQLPFSLQSPSSCGGISAAALLQLCALELKSPAGCGCAGGNGAVTQSGPGTAAL
jgi:Glycosyltransferase family 20